MGLKLVTSLQDELIVCVNVESATTPHVAKVRGSLLGACFTTTRTIAFVLNSYIGHCIPHNDFVQQRPAVRNMRVQSVDGAMETAIMLL